MNEPLEMFPLLCRIAVGVIVFMGATLGVYSLLERQFLRRPVRLSAVDSVRDRPFASLAAVPVMIVTILFALMAAAQVRGGATVPSATSLLIGAGLYSITLLMTVFGCLAYSKAGFREAFGMNTSPWTVAVCKGIRYGLEILPLVLLTSIVVSCIGEALGFDMRTQQIFDCLDDPQISTWVRLALIVCAVVVAPIVEELLFRGVLFSVALKGRSFLLGALLTSLYFSLVHLHAPSLLPLLVLSVAFSAGYASTGSILTPIVMHALFNLTGLLLFFSEIK